MFKITLPRVLSLRHGFIRSLVDELATACRRKPALIQIIAGPRQVGKTTAAEQLRDRLKWPSVWAAADLPLTGEKPLVGVLDWLH